jgi:hypothetical protein
VSQRSLMPNQAFPCIGRSPIRTPFIVGSDSSVRRPDPGRSDIPETHGNEMYRRRHVLNFGQYPYDFQY